MIIFGPIWLIGMIWLFAYLVKKGKQNSPVQRTITAPDGFSRTFVVPANERAEVSIARLNSMRPNL